MSNVKRYTLDSPDVTIEGTDEAVRLFHEEIQALYRLADAVEAKRNADKELDEALAAVRAHKNGR
jgi:hypothetical protein